MMTFFAVFFWFIVPVVFIVLWRERRYEESRRRTGARPSFLSDLDREVREKLARFRR